MKTTLLTMLLMFTVVFGVSNENLVLNVVVDNQPVREIDEKVVVDFNTEYSLLLKNNNNRDCTARIWIDGSLVSSFGDFIVEGNSQLELERFVTESMSEGRRFKFVPLDHPDVDDPSRCENGIVKVEFRLEKRYIMITPQEPYNPIYPWHFEYDGNIIIPNGELNFDTSGSTTLVNVSGSIDVSVTSSTAGATIAGSNSSQLFTYKHINVEDTPIILYLKIEGI